MPVIDRRWTRPGPTRAQIRSDVLLGVLTAAAAITTVEVWRSAYGTSTGWQGVEAWAYFAAAGLLLCARRLVPLTVVLAESVLFILIGERLEDLAVVFTIQMILFASIHAAWAWSTRPRSLLAVSGAVVVAMFGWLAWSLSHSMPDLPASQGLLPPEVALVVYSILINAVYFFGAMAWGHGAWRSARRRAELAESTAAERRSVERQRLAALQAERVRIARDLHDLVAHHVSGIGVQAAGARRVLAADPPAAGDVLELIERSSRQAVAQMHQLVGLLREGDEPEDRRPQPGLDALHRLATDGERPAVSFRQVGDPFEVPPTVAHSLFRIAQEAVANLRRHARAGSGEVVLRYLPAADDGGDAVEVEIIDDGRAGAGPAVPSGGFGLAGIRERVAMHGGTCEIGPRPDGGFRVRARVPVDA